MGVGLACLCYICGLWCSAASLQAAAMTERQREATRVCPHGSNTGNMNMCTDGTEAAAARTHGCEDDMTTCFEDDLRYFALLLPRF
jgi:hypothetical protein